MPSSLLFTHQTSPTTLLRSEVDIQFKTHFPHVNASILEQIHMDNIKNCYDYVTNVLIVQFKYTLLKIEHFLLCENNPLQFCIETVQEVLSILKSKYNMNGYDVIGHSLHHQQYVSPNLQNEPFHVPSTPTLIDQGYFSPNHSLHNSAPPMIVGAPADISEPRYTRQIAVASPSASTAISPPPGSNTATPPSMRGRTLGRSGIQGPPTASSSASIQGPPQDIPSAPKLPASGDSSKSSSSRSSSKKQIRCPNETGGRYYCRSWNLKFLKPCTHIHLYRSSYDQECDSKKATQLVTLDPNGSTFTAVKTDFLASWKVGTKPTVTMIQQIKSAKMDHYFEMAEESLKVRLVQKLYHGTCEANFQRILDEGLQLPSDYEVNPNCPRCGALHQKVNTSTCPASCDYCAGDNAVQHKWKRCHMFGLGIYFADLSSKSDIYVRDAKGNKSDKGKKILVVEVALGDTHKIMALNSESELHDLTAPPQDKDSIMAVGTGKQVQSNLQVMNNECTCSTFL